MQVLKKLHLLSHVTIFFFLGHILEFLVEPVDTVVQSGHSAVLDCVAKSSDFPDNTLHIQWLDQDRQVLTFIGDTYRYCIGCLNFLYKINLFNLHYRSQLLNGSLYISSVTEDLGLTGNYQCMASLPNGFGSIVSRTAKISLASEYMKLENLVF